MALRLRVISDHRRPLGERGAMSFGAGGGTIGRSSDNDWVLPDPQRYVSAHHARIRYGREGFELEDTSTNGLYVNDGERPLKDIGRHRLRHGDVLRIGEYEIAVALDSQLADTGSALDSQAEASTVTSLDPVPTHIEGLRSLGRAAQTDLGAVLNLDELLVAQSPSGSRLGPVNAYGQAVIPVQSAEPQPAGAEPPDPAASESAERAVARRIERLARAAHRAQEARNAPLAASPDLQSGLQAFCRGAGLDMQRLDADAPAQVLHLVGQLIREALVGLKDLERSREEIRNRLRIGVDVDPEDPHPPLARSTVEELLTAVLSQGEGRRFDAVQWIREAMAAAKAHERATSHALRTAFVEFIDRFDPAELEARFERAARRAGTAGGTEERRWQLFGEFYRSLTEMAPNELPHTFAEAFASAYKSALKTVR